MLKRLIAHLLIVGCVSSAVAVVAQTSGSSSSKGRPQIDAQSALRKLTGADAKEANKLRKAIIDAEKAGRWSERRCRGRKGARFADATPGSRALPHDRRRLEGQDTASIPGDDQRGTRVA